MPYKKNSHLIRIHLSVLLFGATALFPRFIDLSAPYIVLGRVFFASLILFLIKIGIKDGLYLSKKKDYILLPCSGILLALHWMAFFHSVHISTIAIALITFTSFPIFTTFLEPLFFREKIDKKNILLAVITFIGVLLIIPKFEFRNHITQGVIFGILSGFCFSLLSVLNKKYTRDYKSTSIAFYQNLGATIFLLPLLWISQPYVKTNDIVLLVILGVVFTALAHSLFIGSLKKIKAQTASLIACMEPLYGIIIAAIVIDEIPDFRIFIGGIIIIATTTISTIRSQRRIKKVEKTKAYFREIKKGDPPKWTSITKP
ncbi:MAG: DMT family transporter [Bacteroidales bacterium]